MEGNHYKYVSEMGAYDIEQIMESYGEDVWQYAFFITKKHDLADDIAQEVFIKAYKAIASFRGESTLKTWLLKITRNCAYTQLRKSFFRHSLLMQNVNDSSESLSAEEQYLEKEFVHDIWSKVMQLSRKYREVIVLSAHYHLTMEEMAETLQISTATIKTRLHRARKALFKKMKEGSANG